MKPRIFLSVFVLLLGLFSVAQADSNQTYHDRYSHYPAVTGISLQGDDPQLTASFQWKEFYNFGKADLPFRVVFELFWAENDSYPVAEGAKEVAVNQESAVLDLGNVLYSQGTGKYEVRAALCSTKRWSVGDPELTSAHCSPYFTEKFTYDAEFSSPSSRNVDFTVRSMRLSEFSGNLSVEVCNVNSEIMYNYDEKSLQMGFYIGGIFARAALFPGHVLPGKCQTVNFSQDTAFDLTRGGKQKLTVCADHNDIFVETNEGNNCLTEEADLGDLSFTKNRIKNYRMKGESNKRR